MRPVTSKEPSISRSRAAELREDTLSLVLTTGSAQQKQQYLSTLVDETDVAVTLHLSSAPASTAAARLALTNVLRRKGRSIDAMAGHLGTIRRRLDDADRELLNRLSQSQGRLATIALRGAATDEQRQSVATLRAEIQQLERTISARSSEFRAAFRKTTVADIQKALPAGTALIEFVLYRPFFVRNASTTAFGAPRYAAYLLRDDGGIAGVDVGEAALIDRQVRRFVPPCPILPIKTSWRPAVPCTRVSLPLFWRLWRTLTGSSSPRTGR